MFMHALYRDQFGKCDPYDGRNFSGTSRGKKRSLQLEEAKSEVGSGVDNHTGKKIRCGARKYTNVPDIRARQS